MSDEYNEAQSYADWLASLEKGAKVIIHHSGSSGHDSIETVKHATMTQVHVGCWKFRRSDSREIGRKTGTYHWVSLMPPTPKRLEEIERRDLIQWLVSLDKDFFENFKTPSLRGLAASLKREEADIARLAAVDNHTSIT